jgi:peptidoglycan/xylan/chitin deacetylase (PgdA/CDA1 family)
MVSRQTPRRAAPPLFYPLKALLTRARSAWWLARPDQPGREGLRILFYHRVTSEPDELAVTPRRFAEQMEAIAAAGLRALDIDRALRALAAGQSRGIVGLSFDDGYRDVAEHALPVLEQHGFTATVFVTTGVAAGRTSFRWYESPPDVLAPDEISDLDRGSTLRFEAHTLTHPNLLKMGDLEAAHEIQGSREELADWLGREVRGFCYPAGLFSELHRELVEQAGYAWAATCEPGVNEAGDQPFLLKRIQVDARDTLLDVRAKLLGGHDRPLPGRAAYRRIRYGKGGHEGAAQRARATLNGGDARRGDPA